MSLILAYPSRSRLFETMRKFSQREIVFETLKIREYFLTHFSKQVITQQLEALYKEVVENFSTP
jgi:glycosyltransferase involved in cell wall biosynthesis